ncbi:transcriptional regulator, Crp/Fnr family [Noviherbaspirillum humi]|uniref:Transcriptional regulator, Crp/Fnr family n=1 Tax=Noviherbaspirillum humi TaxID=1688639 RepID=A0A239G5A9_9BURK|nr:Crp/Fnr family transcriptional regulator [Noviherbaspirillum humi]SNS63204.1 transcriptional regulator, Crp/Fnr family [Noviherbaspirillum humi]
MPAQKNPDIDRAAALRASWLSRMPEAAVTEAAACAKVRLVEDGMLIYAHGAACDGLYTLVRGAVRFSRTTADGQASTIAVLDAPTWFGDLSIFDGRPRSYDGYAYGETVLLHHSKADFKRLLARHPQIYERFLRSLSLRLRATFDMVEEAVIAPLPQRLARRLLELAKLKPSAMNSAVMPSGREVPLTQEELGNLLGKSRQSIAKLLRLWEEDGMVETRYGRVSIADPQKLMRVAYPERIG